MTRSLDFGRALLDRAAAAGIEVPPSAIPSLERYFGLLARWNRTVNLTSLSVEDLAPEAIDRLLLEPISAARVFPASPVTWFDLGSGGGSPAIPLKIVRPLATLTMVESRVRKVAFLREVVRDLGLAPAAAMAARFEEMTGSHELLGLADVITVRAVKPDRALATVVDHLLGAKGQLLLFQSGDADELAWPGFGRISVTDLFTSGTAQVAVYRRHR